MLINGKRALAYVVTIDEIKPLVGYDRVEYARTNGWWVVISKNDHLKIGDKCIYFEIDSLVPSSDERFSFLEKKKYKIKTQRMCGVVSQGLLMPLDKFPELSNKKFGDDVTDDLKVKYYSAEDNIRKSDDKEMMLKKIKSKHSRFFKNPIIKKLMKHKFGRKIILSFFKKSKYKGKTFPDFVKKTDEERIENQPWRYNNGHTDGLYFLTEKLDGTSSTYALKRIKKGKEKYEFYVCSRNVNLSKPDDKSKNIYWEMEEKYHIEERLIEFLNNRYDLDWVYIQGESIGNVQGNPYKLKENDLYIFNFVTSSEGRLDSNTGCAIIEKWGMKWVPILKLDMLPNTIEEIKAQADGFSVINPDVAREGIVYRSLNGKDSFKNVSRKYLLKHSTTI